MFTIWFKSGENTNEVFAANANAAFEIVDILYKSKISHKLFNNRGQEIKGRSISEINSEVINPYLK